MNNVPVQGMRHGVDFTSPSHILCTGALIVNLVLSSKLQDLSPFELLEIQESSCCSIICQFSGELCGLWTLRQEQIYSQEARKICLFPFP